MKAKVILISIALAILLFVSGLLFESLIMWRIAGWMLCAALIALLFLLFGAYKQSRWSNDLVKFGTVIMALCVTVLIFVDMQYYPGFSNLRNDWLSEWGAYLMILLIGGALLAVMAGLAMSSLQRPSKMPIKAKSKTKK